MTLLAPALHGWLERGGAAVLVTVAQARGSTPREAGARMLVGPAVVGTIGGGRLEWEAIRQARAMIGSGEAERRLDLPLGPAMGQCCGGAVALTLERADRAVLARLEEEEREACARLPAVLVFGAGHVGKALVQALAPLPFRVQWIDARAEEFPPEPPAGIRCEISDRPLEIVASAPPGAAYVVLTHSHALDYDITEAVLRRADFAYAGLIGSATKRRRFERWFAARGRDPGLLARLTCPIGAAGGLRDKRPAVIAALAAAELLTVMAAGAAGEDLAGAERAGEEA